MPLLHIYPLGVCNNVQFKEIYAQCLFLSNFFLDKLVLIVIIFVICIKWVIGAGFKPACIGITNSMAGMTAWLHFLLRSSDNLSLSAVAESFGDAGIETYPLNFDALTGPGILFLDEITPQHCNFLREVTRNGIGRVLAIAVFRSILLGGGAWRLLQAGASDVLVWDHSINFVKNVAERLKRWETIDQLVQSPLVSNNLVGQSLAWKSTLRQVVEIAYFTDASILITGESGTGKELVARLIHTLDQRPNKGELIILDCTTIVPELSGSEFFGHERGAFTGAVAPRDGAFALANGGTLFLDEVSELLLGLQAQLLRVVQERTYKRIGGNTWQHTNFRLGVTTNKDLQEEVKRGKFRQDLYYRIASWTCKLPPLRERIEDILLLVRHFIKQLRPNEELPELDESVREYLLKREYPGNVRDLKQLISRMMYRHVRPGPITVGDIPEEERTSGEMELLDWCDESFERAIRRALSFGIQLKEIGRVAENTAIRIAVSDCNGNLQQAAQKLGVTDRTLQLRRAAQRNQGIENKTN